MKVREYVVLFSLALIWGASFFFIKIAVAEVSPATLAFGRLLCSVIVLGGVAAARPGFVKGLLRFWRLSLAVAAINYVGPYLLIAWGETRITSGMASILNATTPLFTVPLAALWAGPGHEPLSARRVGGVALGFIGVGVLVGPSVLLETGNGLPALIGQAAVLIAAAAYGVGALLSRGYTGSARLVGPLGSQLAALLLLLPVTVAWSPPTHLPSLKAMAAIVTLGMLGTGIAYLLYFWLIEHVGATRTTLVTYLLPCTALVWGALLLRETVTWYALAGLGLVLLGTMVTNGTLVGLLGRLRPLSRSARTPAERVAPRR